MTVDPEENFSGVLNWLPLGGAHCFYVWNIPLDGKVSYIIGTAV